MTSDFRKLTSFDLGCDARAAAQHIILTAVCLPNCSLLPVMFSKHAGNEPPTCLMLVDVFIIMK